MSIYTAPEVRELGTVSSFTLGSTHNLPAVTKASNHVPDFYTATNPANPNDYGVPCTNTSPLGLLNCNTP